MNVSELIKTRIVKADWTQYKFSDFAENIVEKIVPRESGLEHYIGLEHLDAGSLKINRFGDPQSLKGDKLKIYKGDIIFAKRNAYLKRASLAEFDAVASAHSMVLRAKSEIILPEFFPFFMQSDSFWDVAIRISVGGLSPTINWKQMAKQEFLLPPKDQQAKIAELLWAMDDVVEKEKEVLEKLKLFRESFFLEMNDSLQGENIPLKNVLIQKKDKSVSPHLESKYIGLEHIEPGSFTCDSFQDSSSIKAQCYKISIGDLCYSKLRPYLDKAFISSFDAVSTTELLVYETKNGVSKDYILNHFHSKRFLNFTSGQGYGTKMPRVSHKIIGEYPIKKLNEIDQFNLLKKLNEIKSLIEITKKSLNSGLQLQKSLINEIFSE